MRIIPTRIHGIIDYVVGLLLIAAPWLFDFADSGAEQWVPVVLGAGTIVYSLMTDYELGIVRMIPMPIHLIIDMGAGIVLAASPWIFDFANNIWWPHVVVGLLEIAVVLLSEPTPDRNSMVPVARA